MRSPSLDELALLPEPLALARHFDARNYRLFRWLLGLTAILALTGVGVALAHSRLGLLAVFGFDLAVVLALIALRREPFFERGFRQILIVFLLLQFLMLKVATAENTDGILIPFAILFMILLLFFRMRPLEHLTVAGTTWVLSLLPPAWMGISSVPVRADGVTAGVLAGVGGVFLAMTLGLSRIEKRSFLEIWRREHSRQRERQRMVEEIEYARKIQLSMLPQGAPDLDWLDFAAASLPATEVGGDYYDYFRLPPDQLVLVIGDVAGHGLASGLLLSGVRSCLYLLEPELNRPVEVFHRLNAMVRRTTERRTYVTLLCAVLDPTAGSVSVASAGHPPLLHYSPATKRLTELGNGAPPLGTFLDARFEEIRHPIAKGDLLILYTDGLIEARNALGHFYGDDRFHRAVLRAAENRSIREIRDAILGDLSNFKGDTEQEDDITVAVVRLR